MNQSLYQFAYVPGTTTYQFGYNSIPELDLEGAPADTNMADLALLHDGLAYRLYFQKNG